MSLISGNKINIDGNGNIVVQDVANSTININTNNQAQIDSFIQEINNFFKENLTIIIISTTLSKISELNELTKEIPLNQIYDTKVENWKPFQSNTIISSLKDCAKILKINLQVFVFDCLTLEDEKIIASIKYVKPKTLLIIDNLSLHFTENHTIARLFNDYHIGGCIVVSPFKIPQIEQIKNEIFNHLQVHIKDRKFPDTTIHIQSINKIDNEDDLFNSIKNTILYLLKMRKIETNLSLKDIGLKDIQI